MARKDPPSAPKAPGHLARAPAQRNSESGVTAPGAADHSDRPLLSPEEQRILQSLGAAVIARWTELPTDIQKALFEYAVSSGDPRHAPSLRKQIAQFLHNHKDDLSG